MGAMIDAALRMEEFLELPIIEPIDPFTFRSEERLKEIREPPSIDDSFALKQLSTLGFSVRPVIRSPFEAVSKNDSAVMLTSLGSDEEKVMERAIVASEISRIVDRFSILIVEKKHERDNINSTAVVSNEELKKIDEPNELTDLVAERGTKR
jgi:putative transcriptional regulator